jgi:organic radical activating enzyme
MLHPPTTSLAHISEIFSSLQGEGLHLGERHLFIRFAECHIHCQYCDELDKPAQEKTLAEVIREVEKIEKEEGPHSFVSLTGGEPLLYVSFINPLIHRLKELSMRVYLETNGILWRALEEIVDSCDCIAMDMKPASVTHEKNFDEDHRRFLEIAKPRETFVKIIVSKEIEIPEFESQIAIVRDVAPKTPVVLIPISAEIEGHEDPQLMQLLTSLQRLALRQISDVRIGPRLHRILQIR